MDPRQSGRAQAEARDLHEVDLYEVDLHEEDLHEEDGRDLNDT